MNKRKEKEIQDILKFDEIYNLTYDNICTFVISKIDRITFAEEIITKIYKIVYEIICTKGIETMFNIDAFIIDIAKHELYLYYNTETPNNTTFNISLDEHIQNIDFSTYNYAQLEAKTDKEIYEKFLEMDIQLQRVLVLYFLKKLSIKEIGITLSYTEDEVITTLSKAIHILEGDESNGKTK